MTQELLTAEMVTILFLYNRAYLVKVGRLLLDYLTCTARLEANAVSHSQYFAPADASSEESCMVEFTADSEGEFETRTQSTNAIISVANLVIDEGGVEPRNAEAKANADGQFIIPIRNEGFLTTQDVIVYLQADELGDTDYPQKQVTITVPANGVAYASFDYSDLPPGDARLKVTLDVIGTPTHEDSDIGNYHHQVLQYGRRRWRIWLVGC